MNSQLSEASGKCADGCHSQRTSAAAAAAHVGDGCPAGQGRCSAAPVMRNEEFVTGKRGIGTRDKAILLIAYYSLRITEGFRSSAT